MAKCPDCKNGEGYKVRVICEQGTGIMSVKEWCERCGGSGEIPYKYAGPHYKGDRSGVAWERE